MQPLDRNEVTLRARALRRSMSLPEGILWQVLRTRPAGLKFRRQHPIGPYIADFYCPAATLVVEIDGEAHGMGDRPERDITRDRWMREQGFRVVRFTAREVMKDRESAVTAILVAARS